MKLVLTLACVFLLHAAAASAQPPAVIAETRAAIAAGDLAKAEAVVAAHRNANGLTPEGLEAMSWLGRGALAAKQLDRAEGYARQTYDLARAELKQRPMDQEPRLPIAIGAAIEVLGQVGAARGERSEAVAFLQRELATYGTTSLHKRIQKNIHLLSLEGTKAPALDLSESLGASPPALETLNGRVVVMFFWAHWCADCKAQGPVLERLLAKYGAQGLTVIAPTQRYGYVAKGQNAGPDEERRYIEQVKSANYPWLAQIPVPLAEANHQRYGVSTTPTMVVVDRAGLIRLYHPGQMKEDALEPLVRKLIGPAATAER